MPIIFSCSKALSKMPVKILHISTSVISLAETPATKEYPPRWPLFKLCLMMEKITGPTEMLSKRPRVMPFIRGAIMYTKIMYWQNTKKWAMGNRQRTSKTKKIKNFKFEIQTTNYAQHPADKLISPTRPLKTYSSLQAFYLLVRGETCAVRQTYLLFS